MRAFDRFSDRKVVHEWKVLGNDYARTVCNSALHSAFALRLDIEGKPLCKHCERIAKRKSS